uniref:G-protein coupled receptors family 1 profile domain-containing protein n=1 Tax=Anopheles farauti TaxID=69004 RepID=A0A182QPE8_9DIPT
MSSNVATVAMVLVGFVIASCSTSASYGMVDPQRVLSSAGVGLGVSYGGVTANELDATHPKAAEVLRPTVVQAREDDTDLTSPTLTLYNGTSNATDNSDLWSKYIGRSGFALPVDPQFVAKINPFWLQFDPPTAGEHYGLAVFYFLMMLFGVIGNALVVFMFYSLRHIRCVSTATVVCSFGASESDDPLDEELEELVLDPLLLLLLELLVEELRRWW